jgi:hypothetical protein
MSCPNLFSNRGVTIQRTLTISMNSFLRSESSSVLQKPAPQACRCKATSHACIPLAV